MKIVLAMAVFLGSVGSASLCLAQSQLVTDNFSTGQTNYPLGVNWTGCGFSYGSYNKLVYQASGAGGSGYWSQDCAVYTGYGVFPSDQYATATVVAPTPSSTKEAGVQLRQNATPSTPEAYIACGWNAQDFPADYHYRIWSMGPNPASGGPTSLYLSNLTPATGDVVSCQILGTTVSMKVNGKLVASATDTSGLTGGYPGLYYIDPSGTGPSANDVIWANFSAGSGPPVVSLTITPNTVTVTEGSFVQFSGSVKYADGTSATITNWSSSNSSVASIDSTGLAFAAIPSSVTITGSAGADNGTATLTVKAASAYTPLAYDTFNGPAGYYLGSNWTGCGYDSGSYSPLVYENNDAGGSGYWSQNCAAYTGYGAFPSNQYATATVVAAVPASTPQAGVQLRENATPSSPESYIACGWNGQDFPADSHYRIWSLQPSGTPNSLYLSTVTPKTNDVVWCQVKGSTVTMQVNGRTIATVNDTSGVTTGYPGLYYIDPNGNPPSPSDVIWAKFVAGSIN